ncbi:Lrp/AsnC family transcriptional regulator [Candidatus Woesearchaeota archaeon]|nr:Lrp/AsnC family transcriptional regulator [Candidatus Woesearchaeota archaeon]
MAKIDYNALYLRSENARMKLKEVSRALRKSSQRLKYNFDILENEKMIKNPYCMFDYSYFGLVLFRAYLRGVYVAEQDKKKILNELEKNSYAVSIYELGGEYDLAVEFISPNPSKFSKEIKKISTMMPNLNDYKVVLNVVTHLYPGHYLTNGKFQDSYNEKIIGGDRDIEMLNKNEMKLIKTLLFYPTAQMNELAKHSGLNVKTVKTILNDLMKRKVIKGFKYCLDREKLGINASRLFLKLHHLTIERETSLMSYLRNTKEVVQANKTIGDWDMEIDIEALDAGKIRQAILQIRIEFKDIIERFNLIEFQDTYKKSYLPSYLFDESFINS